MKSNLAENNLPKLSSQLYLWQRSSFYTKMAVRSVVRDPLRSFVAIITVVMSLSLVYLALSMRDSMVTMVDMSISQLSRYDLELNLRQPVSEDFLDSIASTSGVVHTETQLVVPARINLGPYQKEVVLQGLPKFHYLYTPLNDQRSPVRIPAHGVVLSKMLAEILHAKLGDTVNIAPLLGQRLVFRAKIVGLVTSYMGAPIYLNQAWLSEKLGSAMAFNRVLVKVRKGYSIKDFKQILSHLKNVNSVQYIGTFKSELLDMIDKFLGGFIAVILLFSAIIAVGSIYNTAMISVNERQRDIATLSVLGLNSWQIFRIFLLEGLILLVIGLLVGMPAAYYMSKLLSYTYNTEMLRFPVVIYFHRLYESVIILGLFFVMSYLVVLRFIAKTVWQELLNIRE